MKKILLAVEKPSGNHAICLFKVESDIMSRVEEMAKALIRIVPNEIMLLGLAQDKIPFPAIDDDLDIYMDSNISSQNDVFETGAREDVDLIIHMTEKGGCVAEARRLTLDEVVSELMGKNGKKYDLH